MSRIRELIPRDIPEAAAILAGSEPCLMTGQTVESLERLLRSAVGRGTAFVAFDDSTIVGVASFIADPVLASGGCLRFMVVTEALRGRGIGRELLGFIERKTFKTCASLYVSIAEGNAPAMRFFERMGYMRIAEVPPPTATGEAEWILRKTARLEQGRRLA